MQIGPVAAGFLHGDRQTDEQTDVAELIVTPHNLANAPKTKSFFNIKAGGACSNHCDVKD